MSTFKDGSGTRVSYAVTFINAPLVDVDTRDAVVRLIHEGTGAKQVRAVTERVVRWSGSHDDSTRDYELLAHVGPMRPETFLDRMQAGPVVPERITIKVKAVKLLICQECRFALEYGPETPAQRRAASLLRAKWGTFKITLGMLTGVAGCGIDHAATSDEHTQTCEALGFAYTTCDGCGSALAGDRCPAMAW
jgi:hypothetical protein